MDHASSSLFPDVACPISDVPGNVRSGMEVAMTMGTQYRPTPEPEMHPGRNAMDWLGIGIVVLTLALWGALMVL
ncbi:hypothetical protein ATCC53582_00948 [Novacetimonas hansenii]|nr:hypothetical protein CFR74_01355 [Novacetimonas hansenii]RFP01193.1 hypothetical protein BGC30_05120 [Novacetimonas hansenii]CUW46845.1 hypothetical protein ATCC53582_00948 [Novacetimonas hansenii]